jgi:nucleoside-diphosphate-sugar epimerase
MHVLFIGGSGLISTSISRQLIERGDKVTFFNRGKTPVRLPEGSYEVINGDRSDYAAFENTFADKKYDIVVDMFAFHPDAAASDIRAFAGRTGQFIFCSTVCVYSGPVKTIPVPETEPYHSIGGYGKNKAACEELLLQAHAEGKMPVTIMRPSHSYGEGGPVIRPVGPADTFIDRLRKGKPVLVQGDGNGLWASCHVDDVAKGFIATMGNSKCYGQAYNITADEYFSWNMYHEQVAEVAGGTYLPVYIPTDLLHERAPGLTGGTWEIFAWPSIFDNSKIKRDTDYPGQTIPFKEGVRRTLAWMEENNKIADSAKDTEEDILIEWWQKAVRTS